MTLLASQRMLSHLAGRSGCHVAKAVTRALTGASASNIAAWKERGVIDDRELVQFQTLHEMQVNSCEVYAQNELFGTYTETSKSFEWMTFAEFAHQVDTCRTILKDMGVTAGDKVGVISNNRWEWAALASASYSLNANLVPMYEAQLPSDWTYILNDSGAKTVFCANHNIWKLVQEDVLPNTPLLSNNIVLTTPVDEPDAPYALANLMVQAEADTTGLLIDKPLPHDLANLIYTSGTTGKPKGVELTHDNFCSNVIGASRSMGRFEIEMICFYVRCSMTLTQSSFLCFSSITLVANPKDFVREDDRTLAFLPWAHSYGQTCELWMTMTHGGSMGICRGVPHILEDLTMVKPTALFAVPTLYKRIYDGVHNMMESASPLRKRLMKTALQMGVEKTKIRNGERADFGLVDSIRYKVLDSLVLSKIRARFGGRLRHGFVAGAACPTEVLSFMDSIGIAICEGYGLTETSPIIAINVPDHRTVGSVGRPIGGVKVYIIDDETGEPLPPGEEGEICAVGPNVMRGYYNNKEATDEVISIAPDGKSRMFHTGDLGRMDENGWIRVTGRLKEQYKLENGKYVVPTPIEEAIGLSRFISQVVLCGANRPYNVALLVPDLVAIRSHLKLTESTTDEEVIHDERVQSLIDNEIQSTCSKLKKFEIPQAWAFVPAFTAANHMLTPKMSIRRHKVIQTYGDIIQHLYGDDPVVAEAADSKGAKEHANAEAA
jgi:long-chain acyl-CoA synthetase